MLDGHILNDAASGSAMSAFVDRLAVEHIARIELIQGPVSSLYGANAYLGMINIITKKGQDVAGVSGRVSTEYDLYVQADNGNFAIKGRYVKRHGGCFFGSQ